MGAQVEGRDHGMGSRADRGRNRAGGERVHSRPAPQARPRGRGGRVRRRGCLGAAPQWGVPSRVDHFDRSSTRTYSIIFILNYMRNR